MTKRMCVLILFILGILSAGGIVFGQGELVIADHFGTSATRHRKDVNDQIVQAAGNEDDGKTVIEFVLPLQSEDSSDKTLQVGEAVAVILAYHATSDRLTTRHTKRSTTQITLD